MAVRDGLDLGRQRGLARGKGGNIFPDGFVIGAQEHAVDGSIHCKFVVLNCIHESHPMEFCFPITAPCGDLADIYGPLRRDLSKNFPHAFNLKSSTFNPLQGKRAGDGVRTPTRPSPVTFNLQLSTFNSYATTAAISTPRPNCFRYPAARDLRPRRCFRAARPIPWATPVGPGRTHSLHRRGTGS